MHTEVSNGKIGRGVWRKRVKTDYQGMHRMCKLGRRGKRRGRLHLR